MPGEISKELIRQIEIISAVLEDRGGLTENDLCDMFNLSLASLRRDFNKIRAMGIPLHCSRKHIDLEQKKIDNRTLNKLINIYLALNESETIRNLGAISRIFKDKTLSLFVKIVKAINKKQIIELTYGYDDVGQPQRRHVTPSGFFKTNRSFMLMGLENDELDHAKVFLLERIIEVKFTNRRSSHKELPPLYDFLRNTWGTYLGGKTENVVLKFDKIYADDLKKRIYLEDQDYEETEDYFLLKFKVKISSEFISWILGWGSKAEVMEPEHLKLKVIQKAKEIITKYKY